MPESRHRASTSVYGHGISNAAPGPEEVLDRPYHYGGRDTEPEPRVLAQRVRDEIAARKSSGTRESYAEQCTRVYTRTGKVAHLMSPVQSIRNGSVLCDRVIPEWFTGWHGTGSQGETDRAASLPLCRRCEDQARREDAYYREPSQWRQRGEGHHA